MELDGTPGTIGPEFPKACEPKRRPTNEPTNLNQEYMYIYIYIYIYIHIRYVYI